MATETEQALIDAQIYGDPKAFIDAELAQLMPAHPGSVGPYLGVIQGGPQTETQQAPWRGITYQRGNIPGSQAPSDFGYYRDMTDMLAASGRLNAEDLGYQSTIDATDPLRAAQHAMSGDTYGLQAGLKAGLAKQVSPFSAFIGPNTWGFLQKGQEGIKSFLGKGGSPEMLESEISNAERALKAYRADRLQEARKTLDKPWWGSKLMGRLNETFPVINEPWWGGDLMDAGKNLVSSIISPAAASHTDSGVGGDEIPTTVDVMPVIPPPADFRSNMPVYDPVAVSFSRATPQVFYTDSGPMPTQEQIDISVENLGRLHREAQQAGPMESQVSQALSDYAFGRDVQPELQAITQLAEVDPTFNFEKYLDPASQEVMDITSQVESFSDIRDRAAEDQRQRDREQDQREERLEKAADDRRKSEQQARVEAKASAAAKRAETRKIASENKARKAEEKRIANKQQKEEKQRRAIEKQMADMLKQAEETRQAYLARKRQEEDRRRRAGYGVGAMWT